MGLKKNVLYSTFLTGANYIFPLITFPYTSRVLGAEGIGNYEFAMRVVGYFILFASMGIGTVGTREIAKCGSNNELRSSAFSSIIILNLITTGIVLLAYLLCVFLFPPFFEIRLLLLIGTIQIVFTPFLIEWLYKGVEDFPYITKRSLLVRVLYVILLFVLVHDSSDVSIYFVLTILSMVLNVFFNWFYKKRYVNLDLKDINIKNYIKPYIVFGVYALLTSMYISFNVVYLGIVGTNTDVGYYSTATKLFGVVLAFFTAFSAVMMPRVSNMLANDDLKGVYKLTYQSFEILIPISFFIILICEIYAPEIILILAGTGYEGAIIPFRLILPLIFIIGLEQILIVQILTPMRKDKAILINSVAGSCTGLLLNFLLVPHLFSIGSSLVWFCSELVVTCSALYFVLKYVGNVVPIKLLIKNVFLFILAAIVLVMMHQTDMNYLLNLVIAVIILGIYTLLTQRYILKNSLLLSILDKRK